KELSAMAVEPDAEGIFLAGDMGEADDEQHAIERADFVVVIDGCRGKEPKGATGAGPKVLPTIGDVGCTGRSEGVPAALEIQALARSDVEGAGQGQTVLGCWARPLDGTPAPEGAQILLGIADERGALAGAECSNGPVLFECDQLVVHRRH